MAQETKYFALQGGLDLITPAIMTPAGRAIGASNYEPQSRGYRRCDGFERFDGRTKPSEATYWLLSFDAGTAEVPEGETVTGGTSGATGIALIDAVVLTGSYGGADAAGYLILTDVTGTFQNDEALTSASGAATADGIASERGAESDEDDTLWYRDAVVTARGNIAAVPGSGRVNGVWVYKGDTYAVRDNAGATAGVMHKATASGWTAIDLGQQIDFDAGTAAFAEGETLTGGTSGATATIRRIVLEDGDWSTNDAEGYLILSGVTGTFQNNETITGGTSSGSAAADGANSAITLPAGGRYEFRNHNFFGASNLTRMYGVNGVGRGFEFDGTVFVPIRTGMASDAPKHLAVHKQHLFFAFAGGSVQHSGTGDPYAWTVLLGAAEIGLGEEVTGMLSDVSGILAIFGRNKVAILNGNDSSDWVLGFLADDAGGVEWTIQKMMRPLYLDDRGVRDLSATDRFGDFRVGSVTQMVSPIFSRLRAAGISATASVRTRGKDLYRLFFSDGSGLSIYLGGKDPEILTFNLGKAVYAICSSEDADGDEIMFFASDADDGGWVYQLDAGTSFDGEAIAAYLRLPFNHIGSPTQNKRWHKATLEVDAAPSATLGVLAEFAYADPDLSAAVEQTFDISAGGGFWDVATWDSFFWSSPVEGLAEADIDGFGQNMSLAVVSESIWEKPHTVHGLTLHFSYRGLKR